VKDRIDERRVSRTLERDPIVVEEHAVVASAAVNEDPDAVVSNRGIPDRSWAANRVLLHAFDDYMIDQLPAQYASYGVAGGALVFDASAFDARVGDALSPARGKGGAVDRVRPTSNYAYILDVTVTGAARTERDVDRVSAPIFPERPAEQEVIVVAAAVQSNSFSERQAVTRIIDEA
jgi:hypothetical protein